MIQPLYLLKGRHYPCLQIDQLQQCKCLLIGAGTLGCNVARGLLSWGFKHLTFVDQGTVSATNPLKQSLYRVDDIGQPKAATAAKRIKEIQPYAISEGYQVEIPMPGHPIFNGEHSSVIAGIHLLDGLIETHDMIWLLTDTRESRWLPTVFATIHQKKMMSVGLGLDQYVAQYTDPLRTCCFFCNDPSPPGDSGRHRTVEERCSIVRGGLSMIAAGMAVELAVSHLHPESELSTPLCQVRGFVPDGTVLRADSHKPNERCTACSLVIRESLSREGLGFLFAVFDTDSNVLSEIMAYMRSIDAIELDVDEIEDEEK